MLHIDTLVEEARQFDAEWLADKDKFMKMEDNYNPKAKWVEVKTGHFFVLTDEDENDVLDEQKKQVIVEVPELEINFQQYCWDSAFRGSLSVVKLYTDENGYTEPLLYTPKDFKYFAHNVKDYLKEGIANYRFEEVKSALLKLEKTLFEGRGSTALIKVKKGLWNRLVGELKDEHPMFFDVLSTARKEEPESPKIFTIETCKAICHFKIGDRPFVRRKAKLEIEAKTFHTFMVTPPGQYPKGLPFLNAPHWEIHEIQYLYLRLVEVFSLRLSIQQKEVSHLLQTKKGTFKGGSLHSFKSGVFPKYAEKYPTSAAAINELLENL